MANNLVAYVRPHIVAGWRLRSLTYGSGKEPLGYGSNAPVFRNNVEEGSVLWVFTMPTLKLPRTGIRYYRPALVARIRVSRLLTLSTCPPELSTYSRVGTLLNFWRYVAYSSPEESLFYELNDATQGLMELRWQGRKIVEDPPRSQVRSHGRTQELRRTFGQRFQSPRRVDNDSVAALSETVGTTSESTAFISYSHRDGRESALSLAEELLEHDVSPWLDSFVVDPNLESPEDVARSLMHGIDRSFLFVALATENYRTVPRGFNWTEAEFRYAVADGGSSRYCIQVNQGGCVEERVDAVSWKKDTRLLARDIVDRWRAVRA
jgi:hypothetical protein